jgi:hypothetical protein
LALHLDFGKMAYNFILSNYLDLLAGLPLQGFKPIDTDPCLSFPFHLAILDAAQVFQE